MAKTTTDSAKDSLDQAMMQGARPEDIRDMQMERVPVPEEWLPSAKKMLMETEKARFKMEAEEQEAASKFVKNTLYPMVLEEVAAGKTEVRVAHNLAGGVLRHVIEHLKQQGYSAVVGSMSRSDNAPTLVVGWAL